MVENESTITIHINMGRSQQHNDICRKQVAEAHTQCNSFNQNLKRHDKKVYCGICMWMFLGMGCGKGIFSMKTEGTTDAQFSRGEHRECSQGDVCTGTSEAVVMEVSLAGQQVVVCSLC